MEIKDTWVMTGRVIQLITEKKTELLGRWIDELHRSGRAFRLDSTTIEHICSRLLDELEHMPTIPPAPGQPTLPPGMRDLLSGVSADFAERGLSPTHTANFVLSLKRPLHDYFSNDESAQLSMHELIDSMGLFSMESFISRREQIIRSQTETLLETSVPVVPLWEGILSLPIIGTLDSGRAQTITEKLLLELARTSSRHALLDISGVPTVDTQTAQYLAKTVAAARLMGAECVITGIRPAIAQVMVTLGITFIDTPTRFSLAEGLRYCFAQQGVSVRRRED